MDVDAFYEHERLVQEFLAKCQEENQEEYEDVCEKYPVQSSSRRRTVRRREITVGLLGLSPSRVSLGTATKHSVESVYADEGG